ncbi:hypothetical protein C8Q78DRAFT_1027283 [Trametes maxima]|nr:hypothetical protein C8Q78DRAFT_1027283 [Trametes maxima]
MQPEPTVISAPSFPAALSLKEGRGKPRNPDTVSGICILIHHGIAACHRGSATSHSASDIMVTVGLTLCVKSETGIIFYMVLRKYGPHSSWVGLNRWPLPNQDQKPEWSLKIPTVMNSTRWTVLIKSLEVLERVSVANDSPSTWKLRGIYKFNDANHRGMPVALDTGSSVSWVPPELVHMLRTEIFPTPHNMELDTAQRNTATSLDYSLDIAYRAPKGSVRPSQFGVRYTFQGENGRDVTVWGPADPFLFTTNPVDPEEDFYEGLLYPAPQSMYTFGQNFFHSMFVSLHNLEPAKPYRGRCYVKLAPQFPEKISDFLLPGESAP